MTNKLLALIVDDEPAAREILRTHLQRIPEVEIQGEFKNAIDALSFLKNNPADIVFLDINMPEVTGLSFAKLVQKELQVIFTTAHREYAVEGFELQAVDYLLKPISFDRLLQAVYKCTGKQAEKQTAEKTVELDKAPNPFVFVRADRKMIKIDFEDLIYVESLSDYIKIHTQTETHVTRETISNFESKLPPDQFLRIHRSFIVAASAIKAYTSEHIEIEGETLPISRSYRDAVIQFLAKYE
ncbi:MULTISPECIES: LytTR family DNA-binding domain-containing protein [unclassified Leeuwenhoekiella]|uniref:LytR/AlgR family response regulator transcription factor n=1 Tax=unclassified Leeuwenhoekiella TaxID=2615029 RepID=UPI000C594FBE|nr:MULTISPECIES: LytTR family DNA-binding domain-containing protein [unclassified Leeuwenhoekiella]MAW94877.1 DNA-binding response regulator [Leeuwenhoekiella sp.]MBA79597.1 DNA-binding response regulator [Leeuwenhoekiella sp.]|tara:strand:- start:8415 stop:9137 length:723 start_codon:yes stop_codon:yes gene_type:complete